MPRRFCQLASSLERGWVQASEMLPVGKRLAVPSTRLSLLQTATELPEGPVKTQKSPLLRMSDRKRELDKAEAYTIPS